MKGFFAKATLSLATLFCYSIILAHAVNAIYPIEGFIPKSEVVSASFVLGLFCQASLLTIDD